VRALCGTRPAFVAASRPGVPAHYVATFDDSGDRRRIPVLAIRGTLSVDDAVADLVASAVPAPELGDASCRAHAGVRAAAHKVLAGPAGELLFGAAPSDDPRGSSTPGTAKHIVVCGHSLGAGVAALVAVEVARRRPATRVTCYSFAPPPVACWGPRSASVKSIIPANCEILAFVNGKDCVPDLSLRSVSDLLRAARRVDELPLTLADRLGVLGGDPALAGSLGDVAEPSGGDARAADDDDKDLAPLRVLASGGPTLYHLGEDGVVRAVPQHRCENPQIEVHPRMIVDHFPNAYARAFDRCFPQHADDAE